MAQNTALTNSEDLVFQVVKETFYPGIPDQYVEMALRYCKARKLDPMLKPIHLVPMNTKSGNEWVKKYVVMPGIALYRIDASRSGQYAGMSEPEFGEDVTEQVGTVKLTYPKWCKITVKKIVNEHIFEFTAMEFWKENYATKKRDDLSPNEMWAKRAYGQLAKCTEAQALRKAFPDVVGNDYTKEEMEGKLYEQESEPTVTAHVLEVKRNLEADITCLSMAHSLDKLQELYKEYYKYWSMKKDKEALAAVIDAKDKRKTALENIAEFQKEYNDVDVETGEVKV